MRLHGYAVDELRAVIDCRVLSDEMKYLCWWDLPCTTALRLATLLLGPQA
jgi:hypothetical protein